MNVLNKLLPACALLLVSAPAAAAGGYFGLALGQSTLEDWDTSVIDDGSLTSASAEDSDTGFRLIGGYELNPNVSLEFGYTDFGEATAEGNSDGTGFVWVAGPVRAETSADGIDFGALAKLPVSESFSVHGRLGLLLWDAEGQASDAAGVAFEGTDDGTDLFFGIGAEFQTTSPLAMRLEYTKYSLDDVDMDFLAFSLIYRVGS